MLWNPDKLMFGDRIKKTSIVLATGASILVGTIVSEAIELTPIGKIPIVGDIVKTFCGSLVSGLLSCSFLLFMDRSKFMNDLIKKLNNIPTEVNNFAVIAEMMERYAAELAKIDIEKFVIETKEYSEIADKLTVADDEEEINCILLSAYERIGICRPWQGDFDDFMGSKDNHLVFE